MRTGKNTPSFFRSSSAVSDSVSFRVARALRKAAGRRFLAFTLVELIVVVTILAVLATVGFLALSGYTKDASDATVKTNLRAFAENALTESEKNGDSLRKYVVHDASRSLSGAKFSGIPLVPGTYSALGTNYSVGTPNFAALRADGQKFVSADGSAFFFAAADVAETLPSGKNRSRQFFQVAGTLSDGSAEVYGTYPVPAVASTGTVSGLIASAPNGSNPLVAGGFVSADPWALPSDLTEIFATGSAYVANWASNTCNPASVTVNTTAFSGGTQYLEPLDLVANTVYVVPNGTYVLTGATRSGGHVKMANCTALLGESEGGVVFSGGLNVSGGVQTNY
jgi:prepilin-type N-terminal cleavage/methylation domain-containing protein